MTELSATEAATVARFEAADDAPESLRERLAETLYDWLESAEYCDWPDADRLTRFPAYHMADAALAVIRGES